MVLVLGCNAEPRSWRDLQSAIAGRDTATQDAIIEQFIASKGGTPIVERQTRLIFLAKDTNGQTPRIVGDFNGWAVTPAGYDVSVGKPTRLEGSSWSFLESTSYTNARLEYGLLFDQEYTVDPMNPRTVQAFAGPRSEVRMPFWVAQPEVDELGTAPRGQLIAESFPSRSLGAQRRIWIYLPPGYEAAAERLFPVVYVLDGGNYVEKMDVPRVLDHLIANRSIPPVIAVFSEPGERQEEYSRNPRWRAFVGTELVPAIDKRFRTFPAPDHRVILGSSLAGYGAIDLAVSMPSVFGLCAALAPPEQTATIISNQPAAQRAVVSIKFFVMGGVYDSMLAGARLLRTTLDEFQAPVTYLEVPEGHNTNTFRAHLDDALRALLPS
jgi:enterochelin esterase-like enzyme